MVLPIRLLAALPTLAVSAAFAITWQQPTLLHAQAVRGLITGLLLEFFVLHASGFLNVMAVGNERSRGQLLMIASVAVACLLMVAGFAVSIGDLWPLLAFAVLFALRLVDGMGTSGDVETRRMWLMGAWAFGVAAYLFALFFSLVAELPVLGMLPEMAESAGVGFLSVEPHRMLCAGALYFAAVGGFELLLAVLDTRRRR